jgi:hypothetical protein
MLVFERRLEMTSMELWLTNLLGLTFLCSMLFYLVQLTS